MTEKRELHVLIFEISNSFVYEVKIESYCPKSNENDLKKLLNIHAITVYPLQNMLIGFE